MAGAESFDISDGRGAARRERASAEREATVSRILAGARAVLREHTVFDLTFAVVADAAGTTRQTVHTYFPSVSDLIFAIADEVTVAFQRAGTGLDAGASDFPYRYADQVADIALADQIPNRQVLLVSASQGRRGSPASLSWEEVVPVLEQRSPVSADDAAWLLLTLFRGALFTWAVEEMSEEALRADLHKVADLVTAQRRVWSEEAGRAGNL